MKNPPPVERYAEVKRRFEGTQFREVPTISVYYFWMNTQQPPFDDVRVRRAVNYAIDPEALERIYAGTVQARRSRCCRQQMPGYRKFELYPHDLERAKRLVEQRRPGRSRDHGLDLQPGADRRSRRVLPAGADQARLRRQAENQSTRPTTSP